MPGTPRPAVDPNLGPHWTAVIQAIQRLQQQVNGLTAGSTQGNIPDAFGNIVVVTGTNLAQTVTIGAASGQPGVLVSTGLAAGTAGIAVQQGLATGTITLTAGSLTGTLISTLSGAFTNGQVIGAATVSDPSSGIATPAITPGTTFTVSGSTVTLSRQAAESGTGLYCAACFFRPLSGFTYP